MGPGKGLASSRGVTPHTTQGLWGWGGVCCLQHSPLPVTCLVAMAGKGTVG